MQTTSPVKVAASFFKPFTVTQMKLKKPTKFKSQSCSHCSQTINRQLEHNSMDCWNRYHYLARRIISGKTSRTKSISSMVVSLPREKRTRELATSGLRMATMTCDGSKEPAEQAEPLEAQIPSTSRPARRVMLSALWTTKEKVLTRQFSSGETISQPSIFSTEAAKFFTSGSSFGRSNTGGETNLTKAETKPRTPVRFSVPARRSFSWPPPKRRGTGDRGDLTQSKPAPVGP